MYDQGTDKKTACSEISKYLDEKLITTENSVFLISIGENLCKFTWDLQ